MEHLRIGNLITSPQQRDAIHIAIAPVEAVHEFRPGQLVTIKDDKAYSCLTPANATGIVDPFLRTLILPGSKFWIFMFPGSIQSLRHEWTHPAFKNPTLFTAEIQTSKDWLINFAIQESTDLEDLLRAAEEGWTANGNGINVPDEFWLHYFLYTGRQGDKREYFSCSC